ncbi:DNA alkylation repair protein [Paenibacillus baekrokdamisoli]|uniref:DNA alkylation repair protein n=1 Tax=Paenibacillus baekrokdamisoli TaxID=1712516 RepID=A0A3G9J5J3_9BACL|nr:DNA alkylation repair protein [Paenibacillus baekrokdamisoli]MBB3072696.1 3-methyladenine DNA glycosylase AlkC [Paenibacillus baekrokdamisoli]BBH18978.1 DNA alkylation repair protein [Paenibacillus baekrokdamisoli]
MDNEKGILFSDTILQRKGARKIGDIPDEVVKLLQKGQLQTVNLTEWLAVNHILLLKNVLYELGLQGESDSIIHRLNDLNEMKIMKIIPDIAREWLNLMDRKSEEERSRIYDALATHPSDSVRCWAAYIVGLDRRLSLEKKLTSIRPFAADPHFGVREIAWMALRESISKELMSSIDILNDWVHDQDANIRRFAIESTRPQGVWAKHIPELKENPGMVRSLLEAVISDPAKYVQDSVGNWLNDASKTNPDWVLQFCDEWLETSDTKETKRIVTRARRSLIKNKGLSL